MNAPTGRHAVDLVLAQLAEAEGGVAGCLRRNGITGVRGESAACPVALYVANRTGEDVLINLTAWTPDPPTPGAIGGLLPLDVTRFVQQFDRGEHPELDRTQPEEP
jgi:hypothetical protein